MLNGVLPIYPENWVVFGGYTNVGKYTILYTLSIWECDKTTTRVDIPLNPGSLLGGSSHDL